MATKMMNMAKAQQTHDVLVKNLYENSNPFDAVAELLQKFEHLHKGRYSDGMQAMEAEYWENKRPLIDLVKQCEEYNGNYQVVRKFTLHRSYDPAQVQKFYTWVDDNTEETDDDDYEIARKLRFVKGVVYHVLKPFLPDCYTEWTDEEKEACQLITEEVHRDTWEWINWFNRTHNSNFKPNILVGMRTMRVVQNLCKMVGLDKIKDIHEKKWTINGEEYCRTKDYGWNYQYQCVLADSINPFDRECVAVLSVNPVDYLTMSFGRNWASCHTIDKKNTRHVSENQYGGCYCAGTQSYMLDGSTAIFYLVDANEAEALSHPEKYDKLKRVCVHIGNGCFYVSRLYPDGRDGGLDSIKDTLVDIIKDLMSESMKIDPRSWDADYRNYGNAIWTRSGQHYADYDEYEDTVLFWDINRDCPEQEIEVGHAGICVDCGNTHSNASRLVCNDCYTYSLKKDNVCHHCGRFFRDRRENPDNYCADCQADPSVHYCHLGHHFFDSDSVRYREYFGITVEACPVCFMNSNFSNYVLDRDGIFINPDHAEVVNGTYQHRYAVYDTADDTVVTDDNLDPNLDPSPIEEYDEDIQYDEYGFIVVDD